MTAGDIPPRDYIASYDLVPVGYFTLDEKGLILTANLTGAAMLEVSRDSLIKKDLLSLIAAEDQSIYADYCQRLLGSETLQRCEIRLVKQDGTIFYARLEGYMVQPGQSNVRQCHLIMSDITERKLAEMALTESRQRLQAIFNFALDGILLADDEARYVDVNPAACTLLGYSHDELLQLALWDLIPGANRNLSLALWQDFIAAGSQSGEFTMIRKDGAPVEIEYRAVANIGPGLHLSVIRDVTTRKQVEQDRTRLIEAVSRQREQLRALAGQLAQVQEAERKALAQELHDQVGQQLTGLNLNLNFVRTQLTRLMPEVPVPILTSLGDSLGLIEQTMERIQDVMADLRPLVLEDFGLLATLHWYANQFTERTSVAVTVTGDEPTPRLSPEVELAFFRITQEALNNVAKHAQAGQVAITFESDSEFAMLMIADDGRGFDLTTEWSDLAKRQNWGLLTMIERAEAQGGYCHIESQVGQGTLILVQVPRL